MPSSEGDTLLPPRAVRRHAGAPRVQCVQRVPACDGNYEDDRDFDICDIGDNVGDNVGDYEDDRDFDCDIGDVCDNVGDGDLLFAAMLARLACSACKVSRLVIMIVMLVVMLMEMLVLVKMSVNGDRIKRIVLYRTESPRVTGLPWLVRSERRKIKNNSHTTNFILKIL